MIMAGKGDIPGALKIYPKFPDLYNQLCLIKDNVKDFSRQMEIITEGLKHCPDCSRIKTQYARTLFQWDENTPNRYGYYSNNIKKSEEIWLDQIEKKPGSEESYYFMAMIEAKYKQNYPKAVEYMHIVKEINPYKTAECWNLISYYWKEHAKTDGQQI